MKKLITICLVLVFVVGSSNVFATHGPETQQGQDQDQLQGQGQLQGQKVENVGNTHFGDSYYKERAVKVAPPNAQLMGLPWQVPTRSVLWNDLAVNPLVLEGPWTMEEAIRALDSTGNKKLKKGKGFGDGRSKGDTLISFPRLAEPTTTIDFKDASSLTVDEIRNGYRFIGVVNVGADKDLTYFVSLMYAMKLAMDNGGELAVLSGGMNTIYHTSSAGISLFGAGAGTGTSGTGGIGVSSGNAVGQGESAVRLSVYTKIGATKPVASEDTSCENEEKSVVDKETAMKEIEDIPYATVSSEETDEAGEVVGTIELNPDVLTQAAK